MSDSLGFFQQLEYLTWREGGYGGQGQMERTWRTGWDGEDMVDRVRWRTGWTGSDGEDRVGWRGHGGQCSRVTTYISSDWLSGSLENEVVQSKLLRGHTH